MRLLAPFRLLSQLRSRWKLPRYTYAPFIPSRLQYTHCPTQDAQPYVDSMDEFAQTRPPDDLFDDDFTPIAEPVIEESPPLPSEPSSAPQNAPRGPRARGSGRRAGPAPHQAQQQPQQQKPDTDPANSGETAAPPRPERKEAAVRGDRSQTGGVTKPKPTEEELAEKMRNMAIKNAALAAAHERSTADAEAFEAREAAAAHRRKEDRLNRQQMMGEREKNRQRKLQALGGREWDAEKKEEDFRIGVAERGARRGAHGGVAGSRYAVGERGRQDLFAAAPSPMQQEVQDPVSQWVESQAREVFGERGRGRGRGGRGRGRGRGGRENGEHQQQKQQQAPPMASDFPDLPAVSVAKVQPNDIKPATTLQFPHKKPAKAQDEKADAETAKIDANKGDAKDETRHKPTKQQSFGLNSKSTGEKKSWADQMDSVTTPT